MHTLRHVGLLTFAFVIAASAIAADPGPAPVSAAKMTNADGVRRKIGLFPNYPTPPLIGDVKVAVLDSGFDRFDGKRPYLPKSAVLVEHYDAEFVKRTNLGDPAYQKPLIPGDPHGRLMAQMVWAMAGGSPHGPQFYLLNANGPTLFRRAVRYAIEQKVDVILFSGTFEGAGNYDGRGPIATVVNDAVAAGIIWVNAAGNSGGMVYNGSASVGADGYLKLRTGTPDPTSLRFVNRLDENTVTITLTWNDYRDTEDAGTDKDLDLIVEDGLGRVIGESKLKQVPAGREAGANETKNPRERLVLTELPANATGQEYRIRVKANSANFGLQDRVRILISASRSAAITDPDSGKIVRPLDFLDATTKNEIYPPADHAGVLTVGDSTTGSSIGPTVDGRMKPDVIFSESIARFSNGEESVGSSNAAAFLAGVIAVMKATEPGLTTAHIREWVRRLDAQKTTTEVDSRPVETRSSPVSTPLTVNQQRAVQTANVALEEKKRRGEPDPKVYISDSRGSYVLVPGGTGAVPSNRSLSPTVVRAAPPSEPTHRDTTVHTPWQTPTPRTLAELIRK